MKKKRDIFAELTEGSDALKSQREGKLMALRNAAKLGFAAIERGEYLALPSDQDITNFVRQARCQAVPWGSFSDEEEHESDFKLQWIPLFASQVHYNLAMKTATLPSIRVKPELRSEVQALLNSNESLSEFVETSVRESVRRRRNQVEFIARGLASLENARRTDAYVDADVLIASLERKLSAAKASRAAGKQ